MDAIDTRPARHVMVVHDHDAVRRGLERLLRLAGMFVTCAADGTKALDLLGDVQPDVVLLDLATRDIDAFEIVRRIRAEPRTAGLPVVMFGFEDDPSLCGRAIVANATSVEP